MIDRTQLEQAIAALEAQRAILGDAVVDTMIAAAQSQLAALQPHPDDQRKLATILFADVSGFTALSETLDAEDITAIMNALWQRLDAVVIRHGGRIDKHIGDALMALWGTDTAHEDDPEQAVRAALVLQAELATFREERGLALAMRIGLNTGPVLLGSIGSMREFTAMGDAVNLASRMEHAAPVGGILITNDTYRHIRGLFDLTPQEPLMVKGKRDPVQTYVVTAAKSRAFHMPTRGVEGIAIRMIGREAELLMLQHAYRDATEGRETRMMTIVGDAGVGKSRLLLELQHWVVQQSAHAIILRSRATPETHHRPGGLLRDLLGMYAGVMDTDDRGSVRAKLMARLRPILNANEVAILSQAAGFDFGDLPAVQAALNGGFTTMSMTYLAAFLQRLIAIQPVVMLLEDLHWADDRSLDLFDAALARLPEQQLLVIGTTRATLYEHRPSWGAGQDHSIRLDLKPLSARSGRELVHEILQRVVMVPEAIRDLIVTHAEGNPFYIEELIKMLIEERVIVRSGDNAIWSIHPERLTDLTVPPTLAGVLQARLDSLSADQKLTLQRASVVGRAFWDAAVIALADTTHQTQIALDVLCGREFVFRRERSTFADTQEYLFKHALLREVTYESVLKRLRREYHRQAANWLEQAASTRVDEYAGLIADHYAQAEDRTGESMWQLRAGQHALGQHAHDEALRRLARALELLPADEHAARYAVLLACERIHYIRGEREAQATTLSALDQLVLGFGEVTLQAEVALRWSKWYQAKGDFAAAVASAQQATALATHDSRLLAEARFCWGRGLLWLDDRPGAEIQLSAGLELAQGVYPQIEMFILEQLAGTCDNSAGTRAYYKQALQLAHTLGDQQVEAWITHYLAGHAFSQGQFLASGDGHKQARALFSMIGDRSGEAWAIAGMAGYAQAQTDFAAAHTFFEQALTIFHASSDQVGISYIYTWLGELEAMVGEYALSQQYFEQALVIAQAIHDLPHTAKTLIHLGDTLIKQGLLMQAVERFQAAITLLSNSSGKEYLLTESQAGLAWALCLQGDHVAARAQVELVLIALQTNTLELENFFDPMRVYLYCYEVLYATADQRARILLEQAQAVLITWAMSLHETDRHILLENFPSNRALLTKWAEESH